MSNHKIHGKLANTLITSWRQPYIKQMPAAARAKYIRRKCFFFVRSGTHVLAQIKKVRPAVYKTIMKLRKTLEAQIRTSSKFSNMAADMATG